MLEEHLLLRALLRPPEDPHQPCGMRGPSPPGPQSPGSSAPTSPAMRLSRSRSPSPVATRRRAAGGAARVIRPGTVPAPEGLAKLTRLPQLRPSSSKPLLQREVEACADLLQRPELKRVSITARPSVRHTHGYRFGQGSQHVGQRPLSPFLKGVISPYTKSPSTPSRGALHRDSPPRSPTRSPTSPSSTKSPTTTTTRGSGGGGGPRSSARSSAAAARGGGSGGGDDGGHLPTAAHLPAWAAPRAELTKAQRVSVLPRIDVASLLEWDIDKAVSSYDLLP